jgi:FkbM family methyltransferase
MPQLDPESLRRRFSRLGRRLRDGIAAYAIRRSRRVDLIRLGSDYGGWTVPSSLLREESVCYCAGVGEDTSFDVALIERFGCEVFALDPTPKAVRHGEQVAASVELFHFLAVGLAASDGERHFYPPRDPGHASYSAENLQGTEDAIVAECWSPGTLMRKLGHDRIDLLKADIEGSEYEVLDALAVAGIHPLVICVEFHGSTGDTLRALRGLNRHGYALVRREGPNFTLVRDAVAT